MKKIKKIFIGPIDIAGQAVIISRALRKLGVDADSTLFFNTEQYDPPDRCFNLERKPKVFWPFFILWNFLRSIFIYDCFLFFYGFSLLPFQMDVWLLKFLNKKVGVMFYGSDIRYPPLETEEKRNSKLFLFKIKRKAKIFQKYADFIISHPEYSHLLSREYKLAWVPLDLNDWSPHYVNNKEPIIIHTPSHRGIKGTRYVLDAVEKLKKKGYTFQFILLENLSNSEIKKHLRNCDIVIDQLLVGWHGKFAVEAMASGKPVLCYIRDDLKKYSPELPILSTSPDNIYENLRFLIKSPNLRLTLGKKGRKYVEKYHNSIKIAKQLIKYYEE